MKIMNASPRHEAWMRPATAAALLSLTACGPEGYVHPAVPDVPIVAAEQARERGAPSETLIVPASRAEASGLPSTKAHLEFGTDQDGTKLLVDFLERARLRGAGFASDLAFYFVAEQEGRKTECRVRILPYDDVRSVEVPGRTEGVQTMVPVSRMVTELEYRCQPASRMVTVPETHFETRCHMVSKPVMRSETTYTTQYDYSSKSTRSVPHTRMVTEYRSENECRPESVTRMATKMQFANECGMQSVTHMVTRYEFQYQLRFVPPHLDSITTKQLRATEPVCRDLTEGEADGGNRLEGTIYGVTH